MDEARRRQALDSLAIGDTARFRKTVSEADVYAFAGITGDMYGVHVDEEFAKATRFGGRIAHGAMAVGFLSTVVGQIAARVPPPGAVSHRYDVTFTAPIRFGDTILAAEIDRTDEFPWKLFNRMGELGLLGMTLPEEYDGSRADTVSWSLVEEELARASAAVADAQLLSKLMSDMILRSGTEAQRRKYLPSLARGEKICAIAQTEPGAGSDVASLQTTARRERGGYVLNGTKRFITAAGVCHMAIVVASLDRAKGHRGITLFLVEHGTPGFQRGSKDHLMGVRGLATGELVLEDCWVPEENRLGLEGEGFKLGMISLDSGRIGIGSQALGLAQAAMEEAIRYAKSRVAFGQPIANFQALQFMIADMSARIESARLMLRKAAFLTVTRPNSPSSGSTGMRSCTRSGRGRVRSSGWSSRGTCCGSAARTRERHGKGAVGSPMWRPEGVGCG